MNWDNNSVTVSRQVPNEKLKQQQRQDGGLTQEKSHDVLRQFWEFFRAWKEADCETPKYRDRLKANYENKDYKIVVDYTDLNLFRKQLAQEVVRRPTELMKIFETAALDVVISNMYPRPKSKKALKGIQVQLTNFDRNACAIRNIGAEQLHKMVRVPGIVVNAGRVKCKATRLSVRCTGCQATVQVPVKPGMGGAMLPRQCQANSQGPNGQRCPLDPYVMIPDTCEFMDTQILRLQEDPEQVPTGEMPQGIMMLVDRKLCDSVKPGMRVNVVAIVEVRNVERKGKRGGGTGALTIRQPYLRVLGVDKMDVSKKMGKVKPEEEERLRQLANDPDIFAKISESVAPAIWGHKEIKKAIACLMFGGSRKLLPDGTRLRGDINVLLLGDPSCGKSQFLKFVHQVAPVCVYTSGKGSSAAGLTASVIKRNEEFCLEGGAMVLADGGVVCIDEFDKMRDTDRVAIHEAMEQQTISIAKAGITTTLNSRTSVLAAANPIFGRYDDLKSTSENIAFETTILSRFDLIFIIKDVKNAVRDSRLATHIISLHNNDAEMQNSAVGPVDIADFRKLVAFARHNMHPRLTPAAAAMLTNHYVRFREEAKQAGVNNAIPITVRQLEAIVRISESLAKMELSEEATEKHVKEAVRLFQVATMAAAKEGTAQGSSAGINDSVAAELKKIQTHIKQRLGIGNKISMSRLTQDMQRLNHSEGNILRACNIMHAQGFLEYQNRRKMVHRRK